MIEVWKPRRRQMNRLTAVLLGIVTAMPFSLAMLKDAPALPRSGSLPIPGYTRVQFDFIIRPDSYGKWYIQTDDSHIPTGVTLKVDQCPGQTLCKPGDYFVRANFDHLYARSGVVQVTADDDFGKYGIEGHSNLGDSSATILITKQGVGQIDPVNVYSYMPIGAGNLWVSVVMYDRQLPQ